MKTIMPWTFWALVLVAVFGALHSGKAFSALNFKIDTPQGVVGLRLSEAPCTNKKVLSHIREEFHSMFKAAVLTWGGRDWHSCYMVVELADQLGMVQDTVISVDEEGSPLVPIPKSKFLDDSI